MRFLGSLVISQVRSSLTVQLDHLGIPAQFQALVRIEVIRAGLAIRFLLGTAIRS